MGDGTIVTARRLLDTLARHSARQAWARFVHRGLRRRWLHPLPPATIAAGVDYAPEAPVLARLRPDAASLTRLRRAAGSGSLAYAWSPVPRSANGGRPPDDIQERHNHQRFRLFARADARDWLLFGDRQALDRLELRVREWLLGRDDHMDLAMQPLNISLRIREWLWVLLLAGGSGGLSPALVRAMRVSLRQQAARLQGLVEHETPGNHPLANLAALWMASALLAESAGNRRSRRLARRLEEEAACCFLPDGMHVELCTHYHVQALRVLEEYGVVAAALGCPPSASFTAIVAAGRRALADLLPVNGELPILGDACYPFYDADVAADLATLLDPVTADGTSAGADTASDASESAAWLTVLGKRVGLPPPSDQVRTRAPCRHFADAGYLVAHGPRGGYVLFDAGPLGHRANPGHGHADFLHFVLHVEGTPVLVDPGTVRYADDPDSLWFKRAAAHNTLAVDGAEPADLWRFFRWCHLPTRPVLRWRERPAGLDWEATFDGYERSHGLRHVRRCDLAWDRGMTVMDEVTWSRADRAGLSVSYHLDPRWTPARRDGSSLELACGGRRVTMSWPDEADVDPLVATEPVARAYGCHDMGPVLRLRWTPRETSARLLTRFEWR